MFRRRVLSALPRNTLRRQLHTSKESSSTNPPLSHNLEATIKSQSRVDRLLKRSPRFLHRYISALRNAPVSHVTAFLLLHELTAVVPLFGLAGAFHYYNWLPPYFAEGAWVVSGVEKFGRYFQRKGWISSTDEAQLEQQAEAGRIEEVERKVWSAEDKKPQPVRSGRAGVWWNKGELSVRWVVEFATAYAIVKALLIPRLMLSAWGAPMFARWTVIPIVSVVGRSRAVQSLKRAMSRRKS